MEQTSVTSKAVSIAHEHIEAWSNHKWDKAKNGLASNVHVLVSTTQPIMKDTDTTGVDEYIQGLKSFAQAVVPGSAKIIASAGDDHNAMVMVTVKVNFGQGEVSLTGSRLYMIDDNDKIINEKVIFFITAN